MRRTKEEAARTRQDLLDAALTIFSREGYAAARLGDIAKAAGVTRGAIYHHFSSKAGLFMALIDEAAAQGNKAIEKAIGEGGSVAEITGRTLVYTLELLEDDRRFREVTAFSLSYAGTAPELQEFGARRAAEARTTVESVGGFFQMGIAQGDFRADIDPVAAARALLAYQNGLALLWLANRDAFSIKDSAPAMADLFLHGVSKG